MILFISNLTYNTQFKFHNIFRLEMTLTTEMNCREELWHTIKIRVQVCSQEIQVNKKVFLMPEY